MLQVSLIVTSDVDDGVDDGAGRDGDQERQEVEIDPVSVAHLRRRTLAELAV